jgi:hypothetical protein
MVSLPFSEQGSIRTFSKDVAPEQLHWHWDEQDRIVRSVNTTDWMIQLDDELPRSLNEEVFIPIGTFHRLIKGSDDLNIEVKKL